MEPDGLAVITGEDETKRFGAMGNTGEELPIQSIGDEGSGQRFHGYTRPRDERSV